jgi:NADP-dependent 3-hydroxy acid dehydrogenase YdfG
MARCVFITDLDSDLGFELAKTYLDAHYQVFGTTSSDQTKTAASTHETDEPAGEQHDRLAKLKEGFGEALQIGVWNRHSPASAKNMLLQARSRFRTIDSYLLIGNPKAFGSVLHTADIRPLDEGVDCWIKGNLFLLREILRAQLEAGSGMLAMICLNHNRPELAIEEAVRQAFLGVTQSLLKNYHDSCVNVNAFESDAGSPRDFAAYVFRNLSEKGAKLAGKILRHGKGFLSGLAVN